MIIPGVKKMESEPKSDNHIFGYKIHKKSDLNLNNFLLLLRFCMSCFIIKFNNCPPKPIFFTVKFFFNDRGEVEALNEKG